MAAKPYTDFRSYLEQRYGARVYRVPIDLGLGCPHRDPLSLAGGCTFCDRGGARAVHLAAQLPLAEQVQRGLELGRQRYGAARFLAYFQAFTSTYAPVERLRRLYDEVLDAAPFCGAVISTRPDCLAPDVLDLLAELRRRLDVWVEVGVQTAHNRSLARLNRRHTVADSAAAVRAAAARGLEVAAHVVLGLPGETAEDAYATATVLRTWPLAGVKIHNLHVVAGTALADEWRRGEVATWDEHEYAEVLVGFLRRIPAAWPVMRLMSTTPRRRLLAPRWAMDKSEFLALVERRLCEHGWHQGDLAGEAGPPPVTPA